MNFKSILTTVGSFGGFALLSAAIFLSPAQFTGGNIAHAAEKCLDYREIGAPFPKEGCDSVGDLCSKYGSRPHLGDVWGCLIPVTNKEGCFMRIEPEFDDGHSRWDNSWYDTAKSAKILGNCVNGKIDGKATVVLSRYGSSSVTFTAMFDNGVKNGEFSARDGKMTGTYKNGYKDGRWVWKSWDERVKRIFEYSDGRIMKVRREEGNSYTKCGKDFDNCRDDVGRTWRDGEHRSSSGKTLHYRYKLVCRNRECRDEEL